MISKCIILNKGMVRYGLYIISFFMYIVSIEARNSYPYNFIYEGNPLMRNHGGADPYAHIRDGKVWAYYLNYPNNIRFDCVDWVAGVATTQAPAGPFTDQGPQKGGEKGMDPIVFIDDDGQAYIYSRSRRSAQGYQRPMSSITWTT